MSELKSAYELALERFKKKDADAGIEHKPLTDEQKTQIAELRRVYQARLAELEILHQERTAAVFDYSEREALDSEYRREREKIASERDAKIEKARG